MTIIRIDGAFTTPTAMIAAITQHRAAQARRDAEEERLAELAAQTDPEVQAWIDAAEGEAYTALITPPTPPTVA
jgi:hypothetical protein